MGIVHNALYHWSRLVSIHCILPNCLIATIIMLQNVIVIVIIAAAIFFTVYKLIQTVKGNKGCNCSHCPYSGKESSQCHCSNCSIKLPDINPDN